LFVGATVRFQSNVKLCRGATRGRRPEEQMNVARQTHPALGWITVLLIAVVGLFYVKWFPYYNRAFVAAAHHSIGQSILMGKEASPPAPSLQAAFDYAMAYGKAIWQAMVLGLLLGSAIQALLPVDWVAKLMGRAGFDSVAAGGLISIPGMMCTCCAAPVVVGLRARQASPGGAIAFWFGNTILNPATLVFMGFVLGWNWTALRLALGILMVFGVGFLANWLVTPKEAAAAEAQLAELATAPQTSNAFARWMQILWRMTIQLVPEYMLIVLLLGAARAWLFPHISADIGNEIGWIVALAIAGAIFVIPTAGEVPIIQAMLALGMGVGPAGALLMTLPPISAPSVAMVWRSFPPRVLAAVSAAVVAIGVFAGVLAVALKF
jgi:uncharacterized membrane protein YraQ (UPF0718 family)